MKNLDWNKIKSEVYKLKDSEKVKAELNRYASELKNLKVQIHLAPENKAKLKDLEKRFDRFMVSLSSAQKQMDREITKVVTQLKQAKSEAQVRIQKTKKEVAQHKVNLKKIATDLKKGWNAPTAKPKAKTKASKSVTTRSKTSKTSNKKTSAKKTK